MTDFGPCEICSTDVWTPVHVGVIRDGVFGKHSHGTVARCGSCGAERLAESACLPDSAYETEEYRAKLEGGLTTGDYFSGHDDLQLFTVEQLWPRSLRGAAIADIGCGGGALLDQFAGLAADIVAVEPTPLFHPTLIDRGYRVFPFAPDAERADVKVDFAFSVQVIEHVLNPRTFLAGIRPLLKPDGRLLISTPNRDDVLMKLLPDAFPSFFYRKVHRWYFDAESLAHCARAAGFKVEAQRYVHRYPMANTLHWLRDLAPKGRTPMPGIEQLADSLWRDYLVSTGQADCLYLELSIAD